MDYSTTFVRHFSRLVSLLIHEGGNIDEQKMTLRAVVAMGKEGPVTVGVRDWDLLANDAPVASALTGVRDVAERMAGHAVREIHFDVSPSPADLLGVARILASDPMLGDAGVQARKKLEALGPTGVRFITPPATSEPVVPAPKTGELVQGTPAEATPAQPEVSTSLATDAAKAPPGDAALAGFVPDGSGSMFMQFSAANTIKESPERLFEHLASTPDATETTRILDDLVTVAENSAREGKPVVVGDVFFGVVERERQAEAADIKRAYVMAIRRMSKPTLLRAVAMLLPRKRERAEDYLTVLVRTGEDGADALIDQLTQAQTSEDRRIFFDILLRLKAGVPALVHMLGDARWFVARNAADLLGEMRANEAENALVGLLRHHDDRVRRSATNALMRLGSSSAMGAIYEAIRDPAPQVRMQAAAAVAAKRDPATASTLIRAVDEEEDGDVQLAMLAALGKVATADAVERLIRAAEPERGLFKRKTTAFRVAAVQALGEAKTSAALSALRSLANDKDKDVRDTVARVSQYAARA